MRNRIKVALQVRVVHRPIPGLEMTAYLPQRLVGRAPGAKPVRAIQEVRVENRLQDQQGGGLHDPIAQGRDAQGALLPICLRDVDAPYRLGAIGLGTQLLVQLLDQLPGPVLVGFDPLDRDAVDAGTSAVGSYLQPSRPQDIAPRDPVVQRIEPERRLLLGLAAQRLSQRSEGPRQRHTLPRTRVPVGRSRFVRSGTDVQAAPFPSDIRSPWLRPLRSTVVTRFLATIGRSDSRPLPPTRFWLPVPAPEDALSFRSAGSPRFLDRSVPARCPLTPRRARRVPTPVASTSMAGFATFGRVATLTFASRGRFGFTYVTARGFASRGFARRIAPTHARVATC